MSPRNTARIYVSGVLLTVGYIYTPELPSIPPNHPEDFGEPGYPAEVEILQVTRGDGVDISPCLSDECLEELEFEILLGEEGQP